jgi:ubiquinone/menaquinone biosynthesis C-methylase UbiE
MFSNPQNNIDQFGVEVGEKVVDIGAGSGFYAIALATAVGRTGKVFAIEIQKDLLERLRNNAYKAGLFNIEAIWGDVERIGGTKLQDNFVSKIVVANILFQISDKASFVKEVRRVLRPSGKLLVIDWADSFGGTGPQTTDVVAKETARKIFSEAGFDFEREIEAGDHHYGLVFRRP